MEMPGAEAKTKGVGFLNARAFVLERHGGDAGWKKVLERLSPADRQALEVLLPVGWYSLPLYARLIRAIDAAFGFGDLGLLVGLGRFEAERDVTTITRIFLRFANPAFLLEKQADYWRRFHDTGHWTVQRQSSTRAVAWLDDWGCVDLALCREVVGYLSRLLELVGAKDVRLEHPRCRANGAQRCEFRGRWGKDSAGVDAMMGEPPPAPPGQGSLFPGPGDGTRD